MLAHLLAFFLGSSLYNSLASLSLEGTCAREYALLEFELLLAGPAEAVVLSGSSFSQADFSICTEVFCLRPVKADRLLDFLSGVLFFFRR